MLTKVFQATPPWSQMELEITEDASPLPRRHALWATWVPGEPRKLNVAVSEVALLDSSTVSAPSYVNIQTEIEEQTFLDGIYSDHWMGADASIDLQPDPDARQVELSGRLIRAHGLSVPYRISLTVQSLLLGTAVIDKFGPFRVVVPITPGFIALHLRHPVRLVLNPEATFVGQNGDPR